MAGPKAPGQITNGQITNGSVAASEPAGGEDDNQAEMEYGRWLFTQACDFVLGAAELAQIPETAEPEICFAGRSNVGKSSLINALTGHKALARTSNTPGRTQQLNFFLLGGRLMLCDLPGHGFARAPKGEVERWTALVNAYLKGRAQLRRALLLVDARHGLKDNDRSVMEMMDKAAVSYQIVLTKSDKVKSGALARCCQSIDAEIRGHTAAHPEIAVTSANSGLGIAELRAQIAALAATGQNG